LVTELTTSIIKPISKTKTSRNVILLLQIIIPSSQTQAANQNAAPLRLSMNVPLL
jgi:hypothetical protein